MVTPLPLLGLIDELDARGIILDVDHAKLRTDAPTGAIDAELAASIRHHRDMLVHVVVGRRTGHAPAPCNICGQVSMVAVLTSAGKPRNTWSRCRYSLDCTTTAVDPNRRANPGRHIPRTCDSARVDPVAPPAEARPPAKPTKQRFIAGPRPAWPGTTP
ncbi:hypothetical protein BH24DEI2_BH24DEI2_19670 [soil metagenome]